MIRNRLRLAMLPMGLLVLLFLFIQSCVPKPIADLKLVSVSRVPASSVPDSDLRDTWTQRRVAVLKVSLSGEAEWIRQVRSHELNSYALVLRCDDPNARLFTVGPYVGAIKISDGHEGFSGFQPTSSTVQYDIYLPETGRYNSQADPNAPMQSYDLGEEQMTLCISIAGGAMHGAYGRSGEVRVDVGQTNRQSAR